MQESRLFKIVYYLLEKGRATAPELAERFEVSVRTIYRDIDALSGAGVPIYTEAGRNGGIRLMEHFVLDRAVLTDGEKIEILSALQNAGAAGNEAGKMAFEKLSALFRMQTENWYEMDFSRWGVQTGDNEKFEKLKTAILSRRRVEILYAGAGREKKKRTVEPLKLSYKSRAWYLKAWCTEKEDFRLFKLNRILEWKLLEEVFTPRRFPEPEGAPMPECDLPQEAVSQTAPDSAPHLDFVLSAAPEPSEIILSFPGEAAYRVYDEFDIGQIEERGDGRLIVAAPMPADEWLIDFLLSFGAQVEVIEPVSLKPVLAERALEIYKKNRS